MTVCGIICEYNPFHNGHLTQINKIRDSLGNDTVILSLMSGNFTQRGTPAICDRYIRAEAAVKCGADAVIELPVPYCVGSAEDFARGGVSLLDSFGCVDYLCFGSESGDIDALTEYAKNKSDEEFLSALKDSQSESHQTASEKIYGEIFGNGFYPTKPNDILGCEYISALMGLNSDIKPFTYKREEGFSAGRTRELIKDGKSVENDMPQCASPIIDAVKKYGIPDEKALYSYIIGSLEALGGDAENICYMNGGVYGRIRSVIGKASSLEELISLATCGRYSSSRIRRALLCVALGVTGGDMKKIPSEAFLLAANGRGRELVSEISKESQTKIYAKRTDAEESPIIKKADVLYSLITGTAYRELITKHPFIL